jgi:hypothetical protein
MRSIATLLGCMIGLAAFPSSGYAAMCWVTLVATDSLGNPDWSTAQRAPCREGETNGGLEYYNPFTGGYTFFREPPMDGPPTTTGGGGGMGSGGNHSSPTGTYHGSDYSTQTSPACTPVPNKLRQRPQLPPDKHWCSSKPGGIGP